MEKIYWIVIYHTYCHCGDLIDYDIQGVFESMDEAQRFIDDDIRKKHRLTRDYNVVKSKIISMG